MAIKKSELYSSLWAGADALRGGMDASQYKDYVLILLFFKYISDKAENSLLTIPEGYAFKDVAQYKHKKELGEKIDVAIGQIAAANELKGIIDVVSFNDEDKLGKGKEMVDRLSDLLSIFEDPALSFGQHKASSDDILGDAYEYLMRHFATESGKSKGQFYTPAEVSRVLAAVIKINKSTEIRGSIYDPTCGSGSLLLKAADECERSNLSLYGQEKDNTTAALAKMNMILHQNATAIIERGQSTLSNPLFLSSKDSNKLKTFDYVVANPPFSLKNWTQGFLPSEDIFDRFTGYGLPPDKNGDYAFLLHIIASLNSKGTGAVILPHGVLFRGNAEAEIRKNIVKKGLLHAIIGLPANLFYGTGIPACILVLDKQQADNRKGIFMLDASKGFIKDGNKNRLREQDIRKIIDTFSQQLEIPKYSRFVPMDEIADPKNDYNLNIPRYIDNQEVEDTQDIHAHLHGGIPTADIDALSAYWEAYPQLKTALFAADTNPKYYQLRLQKEDIKTHIFNHPDFINFGQNMDKLYTNWSQQMSHELQALEQGLNPKQVIARLSEQLLHSYQGQPLIDKYDIYQHLMSYHSETMQDDLYQIAQDGWIARPYIIRKKTNKKDSRSWTCDLIPPSLIIALFFQDLQDAIDALEAEKEQYNAQIAEIEEEQSGEDGYFADLDKINRSSVAKKLKSLPKSPEHEPERAVLAQYISLLDAAALTSHNIKEAQNRLDAKTFEKYSELSNQEVRNIVVDKKWLRAIESAIRSEMERISQRLTSRLTELIERYQTPLPMIQQQLATLEQKVNAHLQKMGFLC